MGTFYYQHDETGRIYSKTYTLDDLMGDKEICEYRYYEIARVQSTGLRDNNGVLIFEGDIVRDPNLEDHEQKEDYIGFMHGSFVFENKHTYDSVHGILMDGYCNDGIEVIGNIHENSELLEDQPND